MGWATRIWTGFKSRLRIFWVARVRWRIRVRWLRLKYWWQDGVRIPESLWRPLVLLFVTAFTVLLVLYLGEERQLCRVSEWFYPDVSCEKEVQEGRLPAAADWRPFVYPLFATATGLILFILWWFRDINQQRFIENQRKDTNLKDFQETQRRAAGLIEWPDDKSAFEVTDNVNEATDTLQIAALHQLRPFLRGEYGESFRRPAFELFRALLETFANEACRDIRRWIDQNLQSTPPAAFRPQLRGRLASVTASRTHDALLNIVKEDWCFVLHKDFPLTQLNLPCAELTGAVLPRSQFSWADFMGARLEGAHLEGARLAGAQFEGAILRRAHFEGADLWGAQLQGTDLSESHLEGSDLRDSYLQGADLKGAHLEGANLEGANLNGADLRYAHLENARLLWTRLSETALRQASLANASLPEASLENLDLSGASFEGANLRGVTVNASTDLSHAVYNDATKFGYKFEHTTSYHREDEHLGELRALGLRHVDEVEAQK